MRRDVKEKLNSKFVILLLNRSACMFDRKEKTSTFFGNGTWLDVKYLKRRSQNSKFIFLSKPYQHSLRITTTVFLLLQSPSQTHSFRCFVRRVRREPRSLTAGQSHLPEDGWLCASHACLPVSCFDHNLIISEMQFSVCKCSCLCR